MHSSWGIYLGTVLGAGAESKGAMGANASQSRSVGQSRCPPFWDRKLRWSLAGSLFALGNLQLRSESLTLGPAGFAIAPGERRAPETLQGTRGDDERRIRSSFLPRRSINLQRKLHLPSFLTREKRNGASNTRLHRSL